MNQPSARRPVISATDVGWLSETQMIEVDRVMIEDLKISLIQMMENAGRNLASLIIDLYRPDRVSVLAGSGGNGGGGLVAARHLTNRGVDVTVTPSKPIDELSGVPAHQIDILQRMGVPITPSPQPANVTVDALIGYSLSGPPRGRVAELMDWLATTETTVVSLDTPSGLDVTDGSAPGPVVTAETTLTLAMPKRGLRASPPVGRLYIGDISVPPSVYGPLGVGPAPPFELGPILRCTTNGR